MSGIDVFNGDADGLCALHQWRLAHPASNVLITGVKRDIKLLREVKLAAGTKWNFLRFSPGLVGGHCIGVDPYYLTHKADMIGYHPQVILAGRRINDGMGKFIAEQTVKNMPRTGRYKSVATLRVYGKQTLLT